MAGVNLLDGQSTGGQRCIGIAHHQLTSGQNHTPLTYGGSKMLHPPPAGSQPIGASGCARRRKACVGSQAQSGRLLTS